MVALIPEVSMPDLMDPVEQCFYFRAMYVKKSFLHAMRQHSERLCKETLLKVYIESSQRDALVIIYGPRPQVHVRERANDLLSKPAWVSQRLFTRLRQEVFPEKVA